MLCGIPGGWDGARRMLTGPNDLAFFQTGVPAGAGLGASVRAILETDYTLPSALRGVTFLTLATHGTDEDDQTWCSGC